MFFKITKGKNKNYLYLVEGYRDKNSKVKHRKLASLGAIDQLDGNLIKSFIKSANTINEQKTVLVNSDTSCVVQNINWGASSLIKQLWKEFNLEQLVKQLKQKSKVQFDIQSALQLILTSRILAPESKLSLYNNQTNYEGFKQLDLHHIYRSLDFLAKHQTQLQQHLYKQQTQNNQLDVDVVFYDVTTFYFESIKQDELRDFGFSKDCKVNNVQIVFSMLVDGAGRPIGCNIHKGNTYEGHTLIAALDKIKAQYNIKQVVIVADKGMNSGQNLLAIKEAGYEYIVSFRVKNTNKKLQQEIKDLESYTVTKRDEEGKALLAYKTIDYDHQIKIDNKKYTIPSQLTCSWSAKRAAKDRADRSRLIERAEDMIVNKSYTSTRGARKFLNVSIEDKVTLKKDKIAEDAKWDGIYAIESSANNLSAEQVSAAYHQLWVIEESFRILKSHFETRPMFHWTPERIIGHLTLSYIAFCFEREIELRLKSAQSELAVSHNKIRSALVSMSNSVIDSGDQVIKLESKPNELAMVMIAQFKLCNKAIC